MTPPLYCPHFLGISKATAQPRRYTLLYMLRRQQRCNTCAAAAAAAAAAPAAAELQCHTTAPVLQALTCVTATARPLCLWLCVLAVFLGGRWGRDYNFSTDFIFNSCTSSNLSTCPHRIPGVNWEHLMIMVLHFFLFSTCGTPAILMSTSRTGTLHISDR